MLDENKANELVQEMLKRKLNVAGEFLVGIASFKAPIDTGRLRNSIAKKVTRGLGNVRLFIGTNLSYAPYVEFGTGIFAENGRGRKTSWRTPKIKIGGEWKSIRTRGQKPQPFLRPLLNYENQVKQILSKS